MFYYLFIFCLTFLGLFSLSLLSRLSWKKFASFLALEVAIWSFWCCTARSYVNRSLRWIHLNPGRYFRLHRISQNFDPFFVLIGVVLIFCATHFAAFFLSNSTQPSVNVTFFFFLFAFLVTKMKKHRRIINIYSQFDYEVSNVLAMSY